MGIGSFAVFLKEKRGGGAGVKHGRFERVWELLAPVRFRGISEPSTRTTAHSRVQVKAGGTHLTYLRQLEPIIQKYTRAVHTQLPLETYLTIDYCKRLII